MDTNIYLVWFILTQVNFNFVFFFKSYLETVTIQFKFCNSKKNLLVRYLQQNRCNFIKLQTRQQIWPLSHWTPHWSPNSRKGRSRAQKGDQRVIKEKRAPVETRGRSGSDRAILILFGSRIKAGSDRPFGLMGDQKSSGNAKGDQTPQFACKTVFFWTHFRSPKGGSMRDHTQVGMRQRFHACNSSCCGIPILQLWIQWERDPRDSIFLIHLLKIVCFYILAQQKC